MTGAALLNLKPKVLVKVIGTREPRWVGTTLVFLKLQRDNSGRVFGAFRPRYENVNGAILTPLYFWASEVEPLME